MRCGQTYLLGDEPAGVGLWPVQQPVLQLVELLSGCGSGCGLIDSLNLLYSFDRSQHSRHRVRGVRSVDERYKIVPHEH